MDLLFFPVMLLAVLFPAALFKRRHNLAEALALGALTSLAGWSWLAFARFLFLLPPSSPRTVGLIAAGLSLAGAIGVGQQFIRRSRRPLQSFEPDRYRLLAVIAGAVLLAVGVEATVPHFGIANLYYDWWEHFDLARFYSTVGDLSRRYQDGYTVTSRTPVYNLLTSLGLTAFGERFTVFQVGTAALAWLWVLPAILLARRYLRDHALALVALLALSPLLLFATTYTWPKGLVAFFALLALDRLLVLREKAALAPGAAAQFGLAAGLTLMTHEGFIGYLLPLFGLLLWDCLKRRARWSALLTSATVALLVALPWYSWAVAQYGLRGGLIGYPVLGYASPVLWLLDHIVIVVSSMVPITVLFHAYGDGAVQQLLVAYLRTAVGLTGVVFFIRVAARALHRRTTPRAATAPLSGFALAGIASTTLLLNGWSVGWASAESVFIPALVALLLIALSRAPVTRGMLAVAAAECLLILALALFYMWSPAAAGEPNARLAAIEQIRFLGHDARIVGVALLVVGLATSFYGAFGFSLHKEKEPRAGWREAPLAS
jgi:hypothetical protein